MSPVEKIIRYSIGLIYVVFIAYLLYRYFVAGVLDQYLIYVAAVISVLVLGVDARIQNKRSVKKIR